MFQSKNNLLAYILAAVIFLTATAIQAQEIAATAVSVRGMVTATNDAGDQRRLKRGDPVYAGDLIETAKRARLRMAFTDGGTTVLKAETVFEIADYSFSGQEDGSERASFSLLRGTLEALSGLIGKTNKQAFRLDTPLATIGLRGTEYVVAVFPGTNGGPPTVRVSVAGGAIVYTSPGAPPIAVEQGNSTEQTGGQAPQTSNVIIEPLVTITVEGDDVEEAIEQLFAPEVVTEADAAEAAADTVEETVVEDTSAATDASSTPEAELLPEIVEELNLTDEQLADLAKELEAIGVDTGGIVSPGKNTSDAQTQ